MKTSLTNGFSLSWAGARGEAEDGAMAVNEGPQRPASRPREPPGHTCNVWAAGGGGRRAPPKDGEPFALISPAAFCSVYPQKGKKKKKKKLKKKSFLSFGGGPT